MTSVKDALLSLWGRINKDPTGLLPNASSYDPAGETNASRALAYKIGGKFGAFASDYLPVTSTANAFEDFRDADNFSDKMTSGLAMIGMPITAYHGSPHDFDKFSMDKIGTGEGAQAYGHGLYFAENEGVAKSYRDALRPSGMDVTAGGRTFNYSSSAPMNHPEIKALSGQLRSDAPEWLKDSVARTALGRAVAGTPPKMSFRDEAIDRAVGPHVSPAARAKAEAAIDQITADNAEILSGISAKAPGHMYEVNINANPEDFLDWDRPLSEQSEKVRGAAAALDVPNAHRPHVTGSAAYHHLAAAPIDAGISSRGRNDLAADALREAGIPGIRYLDQGSRGAGEGSRNYVVFNDALIDIIRKYGLAAAVGAGAATGEYNE